MQTVAIHVEAKTPARRSIDKVFVNGVKNLYGYGHLLLTAENTRDLLPIFSV